MHTRKSTLTLAALLALTVLLLAVSAILLVRIGTRAADVTKKREHSEFDWHIMMVAKRMDSPFWISVYEGGRTEGLRRKAVIELVGPSSDADRQTAPFWIDYAVAARVDGILAYLSDDEDTRSSLALAARRGIPVIALESDTIPEARQSFVGVNSFELGRVLGGLIREAVGVSGDALVFLDEAAGYGPENIMLSAIRDTLRASPLIRVTPMVAESPSGAGFESAIRQRLLEDRTTDAVVCLNVEDTMRVAQALIDLNRTDQVSIIAFRDSPEILEYVRKGIVRSVVVIDAEQMGGKAVEAMLELLETKHANDYVITDMHVITRENLEAVK